MPCRPCLAHAGYRAAVEPFARVRWDVCEYADADQLSSSREPMARPGMSRQAWRLLGAVTDDWNRDVLAELARCPGGRSRRRLAAAGRELIIHQLVVAYPRIEHSRAYGQPTSRAAGDLDDLFTSPALHLVPTAAGLYFAHPPDIVIGDVGAALPPPQPCASAEARQRNAVALERLLHLGATAEDPRSPGQRALPALRAALRGDHLSGPMSWGALSSLGIADTFTTPAVWLDGRVPAGVLDDAGTAEAADVVDRARRWVLAEHTAAQARYRGTRALADPPGQDRSSSMSTWCSPGT